MNKWVLVVPLLVSQRRSSLFLSSSSSCPCPTTIVRIYRLYQSRSVREKLLACTANAPNIISIHISRRSPDWSKKWTNHASTKRFHWKVLVARNLLMLILWFFCRQFWGHCQQCQIIWMLAISIVWIRFKITGYYYSTQKRWYEWFHPWMDIYRPNHFL